MKKPTNFEWQLLGFSEFILIIGIILLSSFTLQIIKPIPALIISLIFIFNAIFLKIAMQKYIFELNNNERG